MINIKRSVKDSMRTVYMSAFCDYVNIRVYVSVYCSVMKGVKNRYELLNGVRELIK